MAKSHSRAVARRLVVQPNMKSLQAAEMGASTRCGRRQIHLSADP